MRILFPTIGIVVLACSLIGCTPTNREPPPVTTKVDGKVVQANGKAFTEGGTIEFRNETKPGVTSISGIQPDGAFSLYSIKGQHKVPGAEEGSYEVTITPSSQDQNVRSMVLKKKVVVGPGDNDLTIQMED
ncbi:MAG: hypothetical protein EXS16_00030 [Gemmataceae bacterium]|nr:hypothetical protein [Gemmataceae bacterium]